MPVIVEPRYDIADIEADLRRVYEDFPGATADDCLARIRDALANREVFYAGIFNGRPIAGALVSGPADARRISLIAVRALTRGRGVAQRLVDEIARLEQGTGGRALLVATDRDDTAALNHLGFVARDDRVLVRVLDDPAR